MITFLNRALQSCIRKWRSPNESKLSRLRNAKWRTKRNSDGSSFRSSFDFCDTIQKIIEYCFGIGRNREAFNPLQQDPYLNCRFGCTSKTTSQAIYQNKRKCCRFKKDCTGGLLLRCLQSVLRYAIFPINDFFQQPLPLLAATAQL